MDLYLIRHAEAHPLGEKGTTEDAQRPLTEKGEHQSLVVARGLQHRGLQLEVLLTSPLVRAREMADIILRHWSGPAPELVVTDALVPEAKPAKLGKVLQQVARKKVGAIGHLPHLGLFTAWLIGGRNAQVDFAKAGVAHIRCHDAPGKGSGVLQWLVKPNWFRDADG